MNKIVKILIIISIFLIMSINVSAKELEEDSSYSKNIVKNIPNIGTEVEELPTMDYIRLLGTVNEVKTIKNEINKIKLTTLKDEKEETFSFNLKENSKFFAVFKYAKDDSYASIQEISYVDFVELVTSRENLGSENYFPRVYVESNKGFLNETLTSAYVMYFLEESSFSKEKDIYSPIVGKEIEESALDTLFVDNVGSFENIDYFNIWNFSQKEKRISFHKSIINTAKYIYDNTTFCIVFSDVETKEIIKVQQVSDEEFYYIVNYKINYGLDTLDGNKYYPELFVGYNFKPKTNPFFSKAKVCYVTYYVENDKINKNDLEKEVNGLIKDDNKDEKENFYNRNKKFLLKDLDQVEVPKLLDYNTFVSAKNIKETEIKNNTEKMQYHLYINTGEEFYINSSYGKTSFYVAVGNELTTVYYNVGNHTYMFDKIMKDVLEDTTMYEVKELLISSDNSNMNGTNIVILFLNVK